MTAKKWVTKHMPALSVKERYFLMTGVIVPRPIAFVTTRDRRTGVVNAAPFSYFNGVSSVPPLLVLGVGARKIEDALIPKDTARNIVESGQFVVNICHVGMADAVTEASKEYGPEESEVEAAGLETIDSLEVDPPRLAEAPVQLECRLFSATQYGKNRGQIILGEILCVHLDEKVIDENDRIDVAAINPLARLAAGTYGELGRIFKA